MTYIRMNNDAISKKFVITITTMLLATMLAASSVSSFVPVQVFAQEEGSIEDLLGQTYADSNNQEDVQKSKEGDSSAIVDPIVQTSVQPAVNVDVNVHVITDKENCEEASDNVNQRNDLSSNQVAGSNGREGEGSTYVGPTVQWEDAIARNQYVDKDVIMPLSLPQ